MRDRRLAPKDLAHDRDIVLVAIVRSTPRLAIPALDYLRSRYTETGDETSATRHGVDCRGAHRCIGRRARGELHDTGAEFDPLGQSCNVSEWRDGVRAIGLCRPHAVIAEFFGALNELDRQVEMRTRIADG